VNSNERQLLNYTNKRACPTCKAKRMFPCVSRLTGRSMRHQVHPERKVNPAYQGPDSLETKVRRIRHAI
jgi:hypothetical protein